MRHTCTPRWAQRAAFPLFAVVAGCLAALPETDTMADTTRLNDGGVYIEQTSSLPATGIDGSLITYNGVLYQRQAGEWVALTATGGAATRDTLLFSQPDFISVTDTTDETEFWSFTVPAGSLENDRIVTIDQAFRYFCAEGEGVTVRIKVDGVLASNAIALGTPTGVSGASEVPGTLGIKLGFQADGTFENMLWVSALFTGAFTDSQDAVSAYHPTAGVPGFDPSVDHVVSLTVQATSGAGDTGANVVNVHADLHRP